MTLIRKKRSGPLTGWLAAERVHFFVHYSPPLFSCQTKPVHQTQFIPGITRLPFFLSLPLLSPLITTLISGTTPSLYPISIPSLFRLAFCLLINVNHLQLFSWWVANSKLRRQVTQRIRCRSWPACHRSTTAGCTEVQTDTAKCLSTRYQ